MLNGNDTMVASCGSDKKICIWDLRSAAMPLSVNTESESCIMCCDWSADNKHILSGTMYGVVNSLNVQSNKMVMKKDTMEMCPELESNTIFSLKTVRNHPRKGNIFTLGMENKIAYAIDYDDKAQFETWFLEIFQKYEGHYSAIRDQTFNKDCTRFLTCCEDHSLRIWDAETCTALGLFSGHKDFVVSLVQCLTSLNRLVESSLIQEL